MQAQTDVGHFNTCKWKIEICKVKWVKYKEVGEEVEYEESVI